MKEWNGNSEELWKKVQLRNISRVILIFLGINLMQLLAYMICVGVHLADEILTEGMAPVNEQQLLQYMTSSDSSLLIRVSAVSALLGLIWCSVLYYRSDWRVRPFSYREAFSGKLLGAVAGCGCGSCVILTVIVSVLVAAFPDAFAGYISTMSQLNNTDSWFTMFYLLLLGPVSEEVIFRGAIMDRLKIAFPFWVANLLQAALFGLYHGNPVQGIYAFALGILLGMAGEAAGSILANIFMHILFNASNLGLGFLFPGKSAAETYWLLGLTVLAVLVLTAGIRFLLSEIHRKQEKSPE